MQQNFDNHGLVSFKEKRCIAKKINIAPELSSILQIETHPALEKEP